MRVLYPIFSHQLLALRGTWHNLAPIQQFDNGVSASLYCNVSSTPGTYSSATLRRDVSMSASGSSKPCPRCGTALPAEAAACSACGWQVAPPSGTLPSEFIAPDGPDSPESWPLDQPDFMLQSQPVYPFQSQAGYRPPVQTGWPPQTPGFYPTQGQPGYAGYAPAPAPPVRARRYKPLLLIALAVVLIAGAAGGIFLALHGSPAAPAFDRHGLQSNVPLPDHTAFQYKHTVTQNGLTADEWIWKVNSSTPENTEQFYQAQLPKNGWTNLQTFPGETIGLIACQGKQVLIVGISLHLQDSNDQGTPTVTDAPQGGSALGIALSSSQPLYQQFCQAP